MQCELESIRVMSSLQGGSRPGIPEGKLLVCELLHSSTSWQVTVRALTQRTDAHLHSWKELFLLLRLVVAITLSVYCLYNSYLFSMLQLFCKILPILQCFLIALPVPSLLQKSCGGPRGTIISLLGICYFSVTVHGNSSKFWCAPGPMCLHFVRAV